MDAPADERIEWRVDPLRCRTVRRLVLAQVALIDAGVVLVTLGAVVAFADGFRYGVVAAVGALAVGVAVRHRVTLPIARWRPEGAVSYLPVSSVLLAFVAGVVGYALALQTIGMGAVAVLAFSILVFGVPAAVVRGGLVTCRLDPGRDGTGARIDVGGRTRLLATAEGLRRVQLGDLVLFRLTGVTGLGEATWVPVRAAEEHRVLPTIELAMKLASRREAAAVAAAGGSGTAVGGPATVADPAGGSSSGGDADGRLRSIDWRRLETPRNAAVTVAVVCTALGVGLATWAGLGVGDLASTAGVTLLTVGVVLGVIALAAGVRTGEPQ